MSYFDKFCKNRGVKIDTLFIDRRTSAEDWDHFAWYVVLRYQGRTLDTGSTARSRRQSRPPRPTCSPA